MKRKLLYLCLIMLNLIILTIIFLEILVYTDFGLPILLSISGKIIPGELKVESSEGVFSKSIVLNHVKYKNDNLHLQIKRLVLSWDLVPVLWRHFVEIKNLQINDLTIQTLTSSTTKTNQTIEEWIDSFSSLRYFKLRNARFKNIIYKDENNLYHLPGLNIDGIKNIFNIEFEKNVIDGIYLFDWQEGFIWKLVANIRQFDFINLTQKMKGSIDFQFIFEGVWNKDNKNFVIAAPAITGRVERHSLTGKVAIVYHQGAWQFNQIDLSLADAFLKINGIVSEKDINLDWSINIPSLHSILPDAQGSLHSQGRLSNQTQSKIISANLQAKNIKMHKLRIKTISGHFSTLLDVNQAVLELTILDTHYDRYHLPKLTMKGEGKLKDQVLKNTLNMVIDQQNYLNFNFDFPEFVQTKSLHQKIAGNGFIHLANFSKLNVIPKKLKRVNGLISVNFSVNNYLDDPHLIAKMTLSNGTFFLPKYGTLARAINITAQFKNKEPLMVQGNFVVGNGRGNLKGVINLTHSTFKINLRGNNLNMVNKPDLQVAISPDVILQSANANLDIQGKVYVPFVNVTKENFSGAVALPDEVLIVDREQQKNNFANSFSMRVNVVLGPSIFLTNKDLKAQLSGHLLVSQISGGMPTAVGELIIDRGAYRIRNQTLTITHGRLVYLGHLLSNPGLSIEAIKSITPVNTLTSWTKGWLSPPNDYRSVRVGASVRGTLDEPVIRLISYPPMSQDDILSYLVFGYPRSQMGGMGSWGAVNLFTTGLNMMGPDSSDSDDPQTSTSPLAAISMLNPAQVLNFNKALTKHFSIQTEAGLMETGIDLIYEYERE